MWNRVGARHLSETGTHVSQSKQYAVEGLAASLDSLWIMKNLFGAPSNLIPGSPLAYWKVIQDSLRLRTN